MEEDWVVFNRFAFIIETAPRATVVRRPILGPWRAAGHCGGAEWRASTGAARSRSGAADFDPKRYGGRGGVRITKPQGVLPAWSGKAAEALPTWIATDQMAMESRTESSLDAERTKGRLGCEPWCSWCRWPSPCRVDQSGSPCISHYLKPARASSEHVIENGRTRPTPSTFAGVPTPVAVRRWQSVQRWTRIGTQVF
jgi:hypothetical protein